MKKREDMVSGNLWTYYIHRQGDDAFISLSSQATGDRTFLYWFENYDPTKTLADHWDYVMLANMDHVNAKTTPHLYFYGI